jgi:hypothetical protein
MQAAQEVVLDASVVRFGSIPDSVILRESGGVHPLFQQAMAERHGHPEAWCWVTAASRPWQTRLGATLSTAGHKRGREPPATGSLRQAGHTRT